jgi:RNA polymerase sigma factor (sigma-70 family)
MQQKDGPLLKQAFYADLYERHAPGLFAYVSGHTTSREDAEDIVLDVFLMVLRHQDFATFGEQKQVAWLWTITRNKVVDHVRRNTRWQQVSIDPFTDMLYEDDARSPEREHLRREEYLQLHRAIQALPQEQQEILHLRFGSGLRCTEIAPVLQKSTGAVRMLLSRTIQTLRTIYASASQEGQTDQGRMSHDERT